MRGARDNQPLGRRNRLPHQTARMHRRWGRPAACQILGLAGMLLAAHCAFALNPAFEVSQYAHKSRTASEGYFKGSISAIAQTPDGYLWLGTDFGLVRFDGVRFVPWEQLPGGAIHLLRVTRDGSFWIAPLRGLARWKGGRLTRYPEAAGGQTKKFLEDRNGTAWAAVYDVPAGRLCAIQDSGIRCYGDDGRFGSYLSALYEYQGGLWVGTVGGLWRWKPDPPQLYPVPAPTYGVPALGINDLIEDDDGALWLATPVGIRQWIHGKVDPAPLPSIGPIDAYRMLRDRDGGLWIGTMGQGLVRLYHGRADTFTSADGLSGNQVRDLFEDREGNVWAATEESVDRFRDFAVPTISVRQGVFSPGAILATRDGSLWIGTGNGLQRWSNGGTTMYRGSGSRAAGRTSGYSTQPTVSEMHDNGLPDDVVESLAEDDRGRMWISTLRGVAYLEDGRLIPVSSLPASVVHNIVEKSSGNFWINEQNLGLFHLVDGHVVERVSWASLGRQDIASTVVADPARGGLWLDFLKGGLAYLKDYRIRLSYVAAEGLGGGRINDIRIDREGAMWAATEGGLSRLKDGRIATLTSRNGLPCDAVQWTAEDDAGSVWLNLPCGVARVARAELEAWAVAMEKGQPLPNGRGSERALIHPTVFDRSDGVKSPRFAKAADGLWFPVTGGFGIIDPRHLPFNKLAPPVRVEQVIADRKTYAAGAKLPPLVRDVEIDYTALSLVAPEKNRFRYKLEGRDRDWVDAGNRRQAFYDDLPPRNYRFRVMAANNDGVWNEAGASFDFSVAPAYYQTTWFYVLGAATALALLAGLYQLRLLYLKRQFDIRFEERVNECMRLARDLHDTLLQSFQGVLLKFHAVTFALPDRPAEARKSLESAIDQARAAVAEGRDAVQGLRSSTVVKNDLARAITTFGEGLASDQNGEHAPDFRVAVEGTSRDLAPLVRDEVYRIAGEALRNAFRHAGARRIEVEIHYENWLLRVRVRDNGKGIDPQVIAGGGRGGHRGLPGMRERAELVGGKLAVWSELNSGAEIELSIPASIAYPKSKTPSANTAGATNAGKATG